jgi:hypothetical protein
MIGLAETKSNPRRFFRSCQLRYISTMATLRHPYSAHGRRLPSRSCRYRLRYLLQATSYAHGCTLVFGSDVSLKKDANIPAACFFPNSFCTQVPSICLRQHFQHFLVKLSLTCEERLPSSTQPWLFWHAPILPVPPFCQQAVQCQDPLALDSVLAKSGPPHALLSGCAAVAGQQMVSPTSKTKSIRGSLRMTRDSRLAAPCP